MDGGEAMTKDLTILVAHCDDEFLFMFPFLQRAKKIICLTSDINNPNRAWCKERKHGFKEICDLVGAESVCLDNSSRFYALENRGLAEVVRLARYLLEDSEVVATHNAWGEYGHWDHVFCHQIARQSGKKVLTTGIVLEADWYPVNEYFQGDYCGTVQNDMAFHEKCMEIYRKRGAMGWSYAPVKEASIFEVMR